MFLTLFLLAQVTGNSGLGVADSVLINSTVQDGAVICSTDNGPAPCTNAYDPGMQGVMTTNPAVSFQPVGGQTDKNVYSVMSSGKAYVLVSSVNGDIKTGDYLTSSNMSGVAQKVSKNGYILGEALEEYTSSDKSQTGTIQMAVNVRPLILNRGAAANIFQIVKEGLDALFLTPFAMLKYIVAGIIVIGTTVFGLINFGRVAKSGVEATGRNPLAKGTIQFTTFINVLLSIGIMAAGVGIAYVILII
jgi:F0F1-type ATP synthase membrane subunit c/vacuolar-type H+-ATPase subunit K